jgi:serine/threonine-protein kinase
MALRQLGPEHDLPRYRELWSRLRAVLHPQIPRFGEALDQDGELWLVREWQGGRTFQDLLAARRERQLVFGAGEVLLLLRQLLPVLAVLHGQDLIHGDISPANLLRRDRDGLPVLLDFGLSGGPEAGARGATPGYAPPELGRGEPVEPWMDLHALGVVALVLLSGEEPADLLDPSTLAWRWPPGLAIDPACRAAIERLMSTAPSLRFPSAARALAAFQALPMPESTGPVPRADRTVVLVPTPAAEAAPESLTGQVPVEPRGGPAEPEPAPEPQPAPEAEAPVPRRPASSSPASLRSRRQEQVEAVEGRLWPVMLALVVSAVVGVTLGSWLLGRGKGPAPARQPEPAQQLPASLPPAEVDQRQQLLNRLRALQIDRGWFLRLVDANLLAQYPERGGRLPGDSLEDAPLRKVWNELAEEWLARVEQLPPAIRRKLGNFSSSDWDAQQKRLASQGLSQPVLRQLVSGNAQSLLPGRASQDIPAEPFRQLWYAAAQLSLDNLQIEPIQAAPGQAKVLTAQLEAGGARLFPIRLPPGYHLALGVNGSPLMQMSVYAADGTLLEPKGPLRVVSLGKVNGSEAQLLVNNEGVAPALITLSLRADPPPPEPAASPQAAPASPQQGTKPEATPPAVPPPPTPGTEEQPQPPAPPPVPGASGPSQ